MDSNSLNFNSVRSGLYNPTVSQNTMTFDNYDCPAAAVKSYTSYEVCPQAHLYNTSTFPNCFGGDSMLTKSLNGEPGKLFSCGQRERLRSIYDTRVQASECDGDQLMNLKFLSSDFPDSINGTYKELMAQSQPTYGTQYVGNIDPYRLNPYGKSGNLFSNGYRTNVDDTQLVKTYNADTFDPNSRIANLQQGFTSKIRPVFQFQTPEQYANFASTRVWQPMSIYNPVPFDSVPYASL